MLCCHYVLLLFSFENNHKSRYGGFHINLVRAKFNLLLHQLSYISFKIVAFYYMKLMKILRNFYILSLFFCS